MNGNPELHFGNYRGEVVRNDDPLKAGRVKVNVFGVFDDIPVDDVPWAIYADPAMGGLDNIGSLVVPEVGSHVWCFFEGGDHHYPVYWAGAPAMKDGVPDVPEESRTTGDYPSNKVRKTKSGILMEMDDTDGAVRLRFYHPSNTEWLIDDGGNQITNITGNETSDVGGDYTKNASTVTINSSGDVEIVSGGNVNITGTTINLN